MARKSSSGEGLTGGFADIVGIALVSLALLLFVALVSFDPHDVSATTTTPNPVIHNWIGLAGAWTGWLTFFVFGAAAYLVPILIGCFGLSYLFQAMDYFHRHWLWSGLLLLCCTGWLDIYKQAQLLATFTANVGAPSAGGYVGLMLNRLVFGHFGDLGATLIYLTLYLISLFYLTNFHLGQWLRDLWQRRLLTANGRLNAQERLLKKRARELEKEARELEDEATRSGLGSGLGPDLQPVPEPTVRDLSIPQDRPRAASRPTPREAVEPEPAPEPVAEPEEEIIPASEVRAATTSEVLGLSPPADGVPTDVEKTDEAPPGSVPDAALVPKPEPVPRVRPAPKRPKPIAVASTPQIGNYQMPPMELLNYPEPATRPTESKEELMANARLMQSTLAQFGIEVALGDITKGPTITRYELHPAPGVKLERITGLTNNIAAALKAERIHVLAPVPGKSSVGVEVPNIVKTKVMMRDLLESEEWRNTKARVPLALGKDVYGHPIVADLSEMPHLLIAGSTGSGKSVCINAIISSLLYRFSPDQLRFVMIDPKVVELQLYNHLPHLVVPVINDPKKVILALRWVINEMEKRYQIFARVAVRNIRSFNDRPKQKPPPKLQTELPLTAKKEKIEAGADGFAVEVDEEIVVPRDDDIVIPERLSYIVVIIDELADLMLVAPADVEMAIARITQMARAAGIHVIVATQRPSVDVITGVIKANIPARIAFQVAAKVDSRTILDAMGADKLLGKGDMLYLPPGSAKLIRAQGALITDQEISDIVQFINRQGKPAYEMEIHQQLSRPGGSLDDESGIDEDEDLIQQCIEIIRSEQKASVSLLQRRLRLGYTRAARIMDELENRGIVGPGKGAEPRDILIDLDGLDDPTDGSRSV
ncbi:MAG: DNA translocase FtsK [Verrucomicrobia bacterium]|nr:DNA translocase FtsK [Verrucomicrobiota bacterium]